MLKIVGNFWAVGAASPRGARRESSQRSPGPLAGAEGVLLLPKNPHPILRPFGLAPNEKSGTPLVTSGNSVRV